MFTDPIFDKHKDYVWPFFWPVFALAILLFRQRAGALIADGCLNIDYEVTPLGLIYITETVFPGAATGWKHQLYIAAMGEPVPTPKPTLPKLGIFTAENQTDWAHGVGWIEQSEI
ncbi:MAG: hypothetical protein AAFR44_17070, partial [Pseudomonadota bacterium]